MPIEGPERYRVQDIVVDVDAGEVAPGGAAIGLPPRTFELLVALARRFPHVVRRQELLEMVWQGENVTDQTLSHRVMVLRRALGDDAAEPRYMVGARGWGYRLIGPVERMGAARVGPRTRWLRLRWDGAPPGAQVLGLVALLAISGRSEAGPPAPASAHRGRAAPGDRRPGARSRDPGADLANAIAVRLRRGGGLRVVRLGRR